MIKKIKNFYLNMSLQKKAVLWYALTTIIQNGILFLVTPIYTRILSDSEYGIFSVYQSWQQIMSIICIFALDRCIPVGFMKYEKNRESFLSSIQLLMTVTISFYILVFFVFQKFFVSMIEFPIYIIITMVLVALANNTLTNWSWLQRYNYDYKKLTIVTILSTFFIQAFGILAVSSIDNYNKGNIMILSTSIMRIIIYGLIYIKVFIKGKTGYKKEYWKFSIKYSIAIVPHALAQIILNSSDRIMIDKICGKAMAAYYSITYSCAMVLNIVFTSISSAIQPWFFEKIKEQKFDEIKSKTNIILFFYAIMSIAVCLIAPEIISIMGPSSYSQAIIVFPTIVGGVFFNGMYLYFANFESYYEKPQYFSIATTTGAITNIILNLIFIPIFGFSAAGYTTLLCYMLFAIMHYIFMRKVCKEKLNNIKVFDLRFIITLSIIVLILTIAVTFLYNYQLIRYLFIALGIILLVIKHKYFIKKIKI